MILHDCDRSSYILKLIRYQTINSITIYKNEVILILKVPEYNSRTFEISHTISLPLKEKYQTMQLLSTQYLSIHMFTIDNNQMFYISVRIA